MDPARIFELLRPFLETPKRSEEGGDKQSVCTHPSGRCHSDRREESAFLSPAQLQSISTYIDILLRWNSRINLTAVRAPEEIVTRHFGESLFAARCLFPAGVGPGLSPGQAAPSEAYQDAILAEHRRPRTGDLIDLGSGAGFPGLPIKIWAPDLHVTLIESNQKKATFLREVVHKAPTGILFTLANSLKSLPRRGVFAPSGQAGCSCFPRRAISI